MFNEIVERITTLKIVKQGLKGYPSAGEARCAPHNLSVAGNSGFHSDLRYRGDHYQANRGGLVANDEVERRAAAPLRNEDALSQSSTPSLAHRSPNTRDRSNRLLAGFAEFLTKHATQGFLKRLVQAPDMLT